MNGIRRRLAILAVAVGVTLALGASTAGAAVTVNDTTPFNGQRLTATISSPPERATQYTLAECDVTDRTPLNWGRDCNGTAGSFTAPAAIEVTRQRITVNSTFENISFVPRLEPLYGPSTSCFRSAGSDPCAVVVSWYDARFTPLGAEKVDLTF